MLCKIKVERVKTIATDPPITEPIEDARLLKASEEIVVLQASFNTETIKKDISAKSIKIRKWKIDGCGISLSRHRLVLM
ncbi:MAG: hypothetical protein PHE29_13835 [Tissierellia bacterium]|nr:hypothetical protein [Tissierellia bacterium]